MYSYEEKMRAVELYLKYGLSAAAVINELEQHIKKNKLPAKDQRVVLSHNNYIMVVVRLSATIRHFRLQSKILFDHTVKTLFTREIELQLLRGTIVAIFQQSGLAPASGVRLSNSNGRPSAPALTRLRTRQSDYTSATL